MVILLGRIITGVGMVIASLGTIMIIVAGILYLTSAGSPEKMTKAKTALIYAIAGIAIGVAASTISTVIVDILNGKI
jgi:riboflavin transporter FmnP